MLNVEEFDEDDESPRAIGRARSPTPLTRKARRERDKVRHEFGFEIEIKCCVDLNDMHRASFFLGCRIASEASAFLMAIANVLSGELS